MGLFIAIAITVLPTVLGIIVFVLACIGMDDILRQLRKPPN
jgi:hypothetical protein